MGGWREGREFSKQFKREHGRNPSIKELEEFRIQQLGVEKVSNEEFARRLKHGESVENVSASLRQASMMLGKAVELAKAARAEDRVDRALKEGRKKLVKRARKGDVAVIERLEREADDRLGLE